ncbi:fungal-specific transcription factor domain-containing protein [Lophiotrema nucula]|uniref:Fungal-specific transcription factor domain-containing protein n=1 Tax=Lophiotrema nucula TaxID=690887 RepID=A0A6A5ZAA9_9PLEO|nr:fungal-specific transcription factor domain-containing protein [Lophiotrema nucula]
MTLEPTTPSVTEPSSARVSRRNKERVRATRACDRCKAKKARCTGRQPCTLCVSQDATCEYKASYRRGKLPNIPSNDGQEDSSDLPLLPIAPMEPPSRNRDVDVAGVRDDAREATEEDEDETMIPQAFVHPVAQSPWQTNRRETEVAPIEDHYIGPSSGLSFLLRARRRMQSKSENYQASSIFTFGDTPLLEVDHSFLQLPSLEEAKSLLAIYFDFAFPTHRFLHRPSVERWLEQFHAPGKKANPTPGCRERNAIVLMVLSQAKLYSPDTSTGKLDMEGSVALYAASEHQLSRETGEVRLSSVQARLAQCFYLLVQSRINHCWSLFGTTARLALAVGLHRKRRQNAGTDLIDLECRKRVFWCAYSLDIYLSAALGRPRVFHDEDLDQEEPQCVNDSNLFADNIQSSASTMQSVMFAPVYHAKLSRILSSILKEQYSVRRLPLDEQARTSEKNTRSLDDWHSSIKDFLQLQFKNADLLIPPFRRQCTVLNLAFSHAVILANRQLLLSNFARLARPSQGMGEKEAKDVIQKSQQRCIEGASMIIKIVVSLCEGQNMYGAFWFTQYYAFCALVVIYVAAIQDFIRPATEAQVLLSSAERCQSLLSNFLVQSTFVERYGIVLEELRSEATSRTDLPAGSHQSVRAAVGVAQAEQNGLGTVTTAQPITDTAMMYHHSDMLQNSRTPAITEMQASLPADVRPDDNDMGLMNGYSDFSPSTLTDMMGWGQFESFIATGVTDGFDSLPSII